MDRGLRERVRWGNVALALAVAAVLALIVAWPLLAPAAPAVPGPRAVPVVTPAVPRRSSPRPAPPVAPRQKQRGWCGAYGGQVREAGARGLCGGSRACG